MLARSNNAYYLCNVKREQRHLEAKRSLYILRQGQRKQKSGVCLQTHTARAKTCARALNEYKDSETAAKIVYFYNSAKTCKRNILQWLFIVCKKSLQIVFISYIYVRAFSVRSLTFFHAESDR